MASKYKDRSSTPGIGGYSSPATGARNNFEGLSPMAPSGAGEYREGSIFENLGQSVIGPNRPPTPYRDPRPGKKEAHTPSPRPAVPKPGTSAVPVPPPEDDPWTPPWGWGNDNPTPPQPPGDGWFFWNGIWVRVHPDDPGPGGGGSWDPNWDPWDFVKPPGGGGDDDGHPDDDEGHPDDPTDDTGSVDEGMILPEWEDVGEQVPDYNYPDELGDNYHGNEIFPYDPWSNIIPVDDGLSDVGEQVPPYIDPGEPWDGFIHWDPDPYPIRPVYDGHGQLDTPNDPGWEQEPGYNVPPIAGGAQSDQFSELYRKDLRCSPGDPFCR